MSSRFALILCLITSSLFAQEKTHLAAANRLLDLINGPELFQTAINAMLEPMFANLVKRGVPPAAQEDFKAALQDWLREDFSWEEMRPQLAALYAAEFSEEELDAITAFYKTPAGSKAMRILPQIMAKGAQLGQRHAELKQPQLMERIQKVVEKHRPK